MANRSGRPSSLNGGQLLGFQVHGPKVEKVGLAFHSTSSTLPNSFLSLTSNSSLNRWICRALFLLTPYRNNLIGPLLVVSVHHGGARSARLARDPRTALPRRSGIYAASHSTRSDARARQTNIQSLPALPTTEKSLRPVCATDPPSFQLQAWCHELSQGI